MKNYFDKKYHIYKGKRKKKIKKLLEIDGNGKVVNTELVYKTVKRRKK